MLSVRLFGKTIEFLCAKEATRIEGEQEMYTRIHLIRAATREIDELCYSTMKALALVC